MTKRIALFASGSGSNVENIYNYFKNRDTVITKVFCNNPKAGVIERCKRLNIDCFLFSKNEFSETTIVEDTLQEDKIDLIVLAGFLLLIPEKFIQLFSGKILNVHPSLLPKYGGKGMYGDNVHKAVVENKEKESGISIHLVDENYDEGKVIFQATCPVTSEDTYEDVALKVHALEYEHFPKVIEDYLMKL